MRMTTWREFFGGNWVEDVKARLYVQEASICGSCFAPVVQRSYVKPITFRSSSENHSLLHSLLGSKAIRWLLRIIVYGVVRISLQQGIRRPGLTCHIVFFLYEMVFLIWKRRVNPRLEGKGICSALGSFFFFFFNIRWRAKSMKLNLNLIGKEKRKSEFKM